MSYIHPLADVHSSHIGENTSIWQFCVVLEGAQIGKECNINCMVLIENDVRIGDRVTVKPGVQIWDGMDIENDVFIGPNATFTNDKNPRSKHHDITFDRTTLREGSSIGANATVLGGVTIGKYALIAAGAIVTKSVPDFSVMRGSPAVSVGYRTQNGVLLDLNKTDKQGNRYTLEHALWKKE